MTMQELKQMVQNEIKKEGIKVSIKVKFFGYDAGLIITYKGEDKNQIAQIKKIMKKYTSVDRCEITGEVLHGGNTYMDLVIKNKEEN